MGGKTNIYYILSLNMKYRQRDALIFMNTCRAKLAHLPSQSLNIEGSGTFMEMMLRTKVVIIRLEFRFLN